MLEGALFAIAGAVVTERSGVVTCVTCISRAMAAIGLSEGPFWAVATERGGRRGGTSSDIFNTGGNAGRVLAPGVTFLLGSYSGCQAGIFLAARLSLLGVMPWFWIQPPEPVDSR